MAFRGDVLAFFNTRYVNLTGDTMTGDLTLPTLTATSKVISPVWAFATTVGIKMSTSTAIGRDDLKIEALSGTNTDININYKSKGTGDVNLLQTATTSNLGKSSAPWTNAYVTNLLLAGTMAQQLKVIANSDSPYTAASEVVILVNATDGATTVDLPAASGVTERIYHIKKTDSSGNAVTIDGNSSETIDGDTTKIISAQYDSLMIICDGSNWHII